MRLIELSIKVRPALIDISATRDRVRAMIVSIRFLDAASRASSMGVVGFPSTMTTSTESSHPIVRLLPEVDLHGGIIGCSTGTLIPVLVVGGFVTGGFGFIVFVGFISVPSSGGQYMRELAETVLEEVAVFGQFGYVGSMGPVHEPVLPATIMHIGGLIMMPHRTNFTRTFMKLCTTGFFVESSKRENVRRLSHSTTIRDWYIAEVGD